MLWGYHLLLRQHAANFTLMRTIDLPKPELAVDFDEIKNPIIPPVALKPQMPVKIKVYPVKTLDDVTYAGKGKMIDKDEFPKEYWLGYDLAGV